jgi:hypothetical protein
MTNEDTKKSDGVTSRPNDEETKDSRPDHSGTMKDIELNFLRGLLKNEIGVTEDSKKAISEILKEINDKNRRNLLFFVATVFLVIGILSFIGYSRFSLLKDGEFETRQKISAIEDTLQRLKGQKISAIENTLQSPVENQETRAIEDTVPSPVESQKVVAMKDTLPNPVEEEECTLNGTSNSGRIVFYPRGEPEGHQAGERVCVLSDTYPWTCEREVLEKYVGKKVYLSIASSKHGLNMEFTVIGFFSPGDQKRIVQIPMGSLEDLVGTKRAQRYVMKGVLDGEVIFPE